MIVAVAIYIGITTCSLSNAYTRHRYLFHWQWHSLIDTSIESLPRLVSIQ